MENYDAALSIMLNLLAEQRSRGINLQVRDIEKVLPKLGVDIGSRDHFILLMADYEQQLGAGNPITLENLIEDYPTWENRIRDHIQFIDQVVQAHKPNEAGETPASPSNHTNK